MIHLGVLMFLITVCYTIYLYNQDWKKGYEWYVPGGAAILMWIIYEIYHWSLYFIFKGISQ